jgi:HEAT repeat protein
MRKPEAVGVLIQLLADDDVAGHAVMALGTLKAKEARSAIEKLASHPKKWIRNEVQKALAQFGSEQRVGASKGDAASFTNGQHDPQVGPREA